MTGTVIKGIGGFYFVHDGIQTIMGKARGNLKRNKELIYVGDIVDFEIDSNDGDNQCVINYVVERRNFLTRPPVSNIDMLVVMFSLNNPEPNFPVIDKLIAGCERIGIEPIICITKKDLVSEERLKEVMDIYSPVYPSYAINGITGEGITEIENLIRGHRVALSGPSGVGKSTMTNHLIEDLETTVETGSVSDKTGRGKHTTRHVEIFPLECGTYLYDTPGFTSLELQNVPAEEISGLLPEFRKLRQGCRYSDCKHMNEPECAVKEALGQGLISKSRYNSYLIMMEEAKKWAR